MVFSSLIFLYGFLPLSLLAYALCRGNRQAQNTVLLIFSLIFYAWGEPKYVLLLMAMAFVAWLCAGQVAKTDGTAKKLWLAAAAVIVLALIGYFKYAGLICSVFGPIPEFVQKIALPIGISFYTFQLLTYVVDVYRGEAQPQRSYWNVLLYAALFHQCIAGPIVRYQTIERELFGPRQPEIAPGVSRFCAGLAKKVLLANPCSSLADTMLLADSTAADPALLTQNLNALSSLSVLGAWLGILAYALHIYLDFSAYSDMAIGMGRMLGLHYPENFNYPYISRTVTEFWRRWHISLSTFFRDYVYIPGRKPVQRAADGAQHLHRLGAHRPVARCQLELCIVGTVVLCFFDAGTGGSEKAAGENSDTIQPVSSGRGYRGLGHLPIYGYPPGTDAGEIHVWPERKSPDGIYRANTAAEPYVPAAGCRRRVFAADEAFEREAGKAGCLPGIPGSGMERGCLFRDPGGAFAAFDCLSGR